MLPVTQLCDEKKTYSLISVQVVQVDNRPVSSVEPAYFFDSGLFFLQPFDQAIHFFIGIEGVQNMIRSPLPPRSTVGERIGRTSNPCLLQPIRNRPHCRIPGNHHYLDRRGAVQALKTDLGCAKPIDQAPQPLPLRPKPRQQRISSAQGPYARRRQGCRINK